MTDPITRLNTALEGRYRIEREIGEGGMATVYLAKDLRHERKVALKVLKPELAAVVGAERFLAEIKTTANLQHPHILPLHDSGEADSFLYFVTPFIEGDTLRDKIDREKQLSVEEAIRITSDVAEALDHAHRNGVVHRDIKPANILLTDGRPVIADFGIALAVAQAGGGRVTETGLSVGTPHYMSPEQATGDRDVDPRTDVYALGCVLYEMLVGEPPYSGGTAQAILGKIIQGEPLSATEARSTVPPNVDAAIRKALERLPADRFVSAREFATALGDSGFRHGDEAALVASGGLWNPLSVAATGVALVSTLALGWQLFRPEPPAPVRREVLSTEGWAGLLQSPVGTPVGRLAALAPDGSSMIVPLEGQLGLKVTNSTEVTPIAGTEGARDVVYSPEGDWIAYAVGSEIFKRPLVGGSPIRLAEGEPSDLALDWLDDGTILYEEATDVPGRERRIVRIPEDGGEAVVVFWPEERVTPVWVRGLPNGRGALVVACLAPQCGPSYTHSLFAVDLGSGSYQLLLDDVVRAWYTRTQHLVYVASGGAVFAQPFDLQALELTGGPVPLFDGVPTAVQADMQLAADGTLLYVEGVANDSAGGERLVIVDLEGNEQVLPLASRPIPNLGVGWSPDGTSVVFTSGNQIYTYNVVLNTQPRQITFEVQNTQPVYSPDGTRVAFSSLRAGTDGWDLFIKDLNDDSPPRPIITLEGNQFVMQWPADTLIVFERGQSGNRDLWIVNLSDPDNPVAEAYLSSEADLERISVSPDGTLAAYRSNESGEDEIYVRSFPVPGERTVVSQGGGTNPFWSPDGNTLYYEAFENPTSRYIAARIERHPVPVVLSGDTLFSVAGIQEPSPGSALHPDGDRFIFARRAMTTTTSESDDSAPDRLILVTNFFEELRQVMPE